jgi:hypothetical protein
MVIVVKQWDFAWGKHVPGTFKGGEFLGVRPCYEEWDFTTEPPELIYRRPEFGPSPLGKVASWLEIEEQINQVRWESFKRNAMPGEEGKPG